MTIREFLDQMNAVLDELMSFYEDQPVDESMNTDVEGSTEADAEDATADNLDAEETDESNIFYAYKELEDQILTAVEALGEEVEATFSVTSIEAVDGSVEVTINMNGEDQVFTV